MSRPLALGSRRLADPGAWTPIVLLAALAATLAGCGESTKTVSSSSPPPSSAHAAAKTGSTPAQNGGEAPAARAGGTAPTASGTQTRTAPEPAFAEEGNGSQNAAKGEGLQAAVAVVRAHGFVVKDTSDYHPDQTLRVLIGTGTGSSGRYEKQAFFFVDGRYIGTDASSPSAQIGVVSQGDTEVTLSYALYRPGDPLCCPGGGQAKVSFQLNNGKLTALEEIPPIRSGTSSSRL
jgi:LppP/LprE lipoprotein